MLPPELVIGSKLPVKKVFGDDEGYHKAEILAMKTLKDGQFEFYVHYVEYNKRLDEWVTLDRLNLSKIEGPSSDKKEDKRLKKKRDEGKSKSNNSSFSKKEDRREEETSSQPGGREEEIEKLRSGGSMSHQSDEIASRVKNINKIQMGRFLVDTWYFSPYPEEFSTVDLVYICEFCLSYRKSKQPFERHRAKCPLKHPPGLQLYFDGSISFFEIDGHKQKTYCRNLCLLSKLFLDHKTLYFDVEPFLFYVMCTYDKFGFHIVGYFSKEKESAEGYNVACILTLPQHQRKGYGKLLIAFSYELSKREGKLGSPEKPLSDLGLLSYRSYWSDAIMAILHENYLKRGVVGEISIEEISLMTSITHEDVLHTLTVMGLLRYYKGQHVIVVTPEHLEDYQKSLSKQSIKIDSAKVIWTPPVFTPAQLRYL